ncbi:hypothetical protein [Streptomyces xanthochromogenes]|uniref:hypothetical protein n=1 Tax=Streptomyces xanthochromogenes TaxID=67384 RepID=UPI00341E7BB3
MAESNVGQITPVAAGVLRRHGGSRTTHRGVGRSHSDERLEPFVGQGLREATLLERRLAKRDLAAGTMTVEFVFGGGRVRIVNGLDENGIEVGEARSGYVRHGLGR